MALEERELGLIEGFLLCLWDADAVRAQSARWKRSLLLFSSALALRLSGHLRKSMRVAELLRDLVRLRKKSILRRGIFALVLLLVPAVSAHAKKVQMAVATFSQSVLPMVVAQEKGYYREEDLEVELILMTAAVANMALLGGSVDFIS